MPIRTYNKQPTKTFKALTSPRIVNYTTVLYRDVPRTKLSISSPEFDKQKCWHCQEFPRLVADPDVLVWCERCYILHLKKFDGTYIQHNAIPAMKQLHKDIEEHKFVDATLKKADTRVIEE